MVIIPMMNMVRSTKVKRIDEATDEEFIAWYDFLLDACNPPNIDALHSIIKSTAGTTQMIKQEIAA